MVGAIVTVNLPAGFLNGYVFDLVLLVLAVHIVLNALINFYLKEKKLRILNLQCLEPNDFHYKNKNSP